MAHLSKKTIFEVNKPKNYVKDYIQSHKTFSKDASSSTGLT